MRKNYVDNRDSRASGIECCSSPDVLGAGSRTYARPQPTNGSTMRTPAFTKSARFRVATARPWTTAVAAMRLSLIGMAFPVVRRRASSSAHFRPVSASQGRQWRRPTPRVEPAFQGGPLPSLGKDENPESQFAKNDGIDGDVWLMCAKPRHDTRIGRWFRRLAQNVGVDQVLHSASVDSESMGTKKSFCGQASSQSMAPSFCGAARRTRR